MSQDHDSKQRWDQAYQQARLRDADFSTMSGVDLDPVYASVRKTHRAVVVQEQWKPFGAAAEISASITEAVFDELDAPVERVTGEDVPMPYARNLELLAVPHEDEVKDAVRRAMYREV